MKNNISLITSLLLAMTAGSLVAQTNQPKLVWSDEFNYKGLPDATKWNYEVGFIRNGEKQYYTRERLENSRVEAGHLVIECRKENFTPKNGAPVQYTSASLMTKNLASFQYGRIETRAKIPRGAGVWPAFWALGTNQSKVRWPACGEIDVMEYVGKEPDVIHGTIHFAGKEKFKNLKGKLKMKTSPSDEFHVYAVDWTPDQIDFFVDGIKYHTIQLDLAGKGEDNAFRKPFYLLLGFALGGAWGGPIDDSILPQKFVIDYVRVYEAVGTSRTIQ